MDRSAERSQLIRQLKARGICDVRVLQVMEQIAREDFVPEDSRDSAYEDHAMPIAAGQTISQPYMVALMTQELALQGPEKVLEIGTGSGYQTAILARLCRQVVTVERIAELAEAARGRIAALGLDNVEFHIADGTLGWPPGAPYDRILVTAGSPDVPKALYRQLAPEGRLVIPVGRSSPQKLQTIIKQADGPLVTDVCDCSFVPLLGAAGWLPPQVEPEI